MFEPLDKKVDRRDFLKISGMLGLGAAAAAVMPASESLAFNGALNKVTRTRDAMGTLVAITVMDESAAKADQAIGKAFEEMNRVARLLDRFDSASPVSVLNRDGIVAGMPDEMLDVLQQSAKFHALSGGRFDITVQPVVDLYKDHFSRTGNAPDARAIKKAAGLVDGSNLVINGRDAKLTAHGMGITLDGIAKGYVIDAGAKALQKMNVAHALINAGGDIRAIGGKGGDSAWTVAVRHPDANKKHADVIRMKDGAIATSGNYEVYFDREKLFHHIVKPATGRSPHELASATVWAGDVTTADALSTAVFVMGSKKGREFIEGLSKTESLTISRHNRKIKSSGWLSA